MKKLILIIASMVLLLSGCTGGSKETLKVYSWGEYIDDEVIREFERLYNVRVIYELFDSNEMMYTNLQSGEVYDVLVPSDYMIERLISEDRLQKLDFTKIPNIEDVLDHLFGLPHDPNNEYSAPYFWGNVGLVYNTETVDEEDLEDGWAILINPKYKGRIFFYDSERDAFMIALKALGYSVNTTDNAEIQEAYQWLLNMDATMDPVYVTDDVLDNMIGGQKDIAVMYSGDATYVTEINESLAYFVPEEGTNFWVDSMVIPKNANNVELAHKWINFLLDRENAYLNTYEVGYTTPIRSVFEEVTGPDGDYEDVDSYVPRLDNPLDEVYRYNRLIKELIADLWFRVKAQ